MLRTSFPIPNPGATNILVRCTIPQINRKTIDRKAGQRHEIFAMAYKSHQEKRVIVASIFISTKHHYNICGRAAIIFVAVEAPHQNARCSAPKYKTPITSKSSYFHSFASSKKSNITVLRTLFLIPHAIATNILVRCTISLINRKTIDKKQAAPRNICNGI